MAGIDTFRERFPEYAHVGDDTLANAVYQRYYANKLDQRTFMEHFMEGKPTATLPEQSVTSHKPGFLENIGIATKEFGKQIAADVTGVPRGVGQYLAADTAPLAHLQQNLEIGLGQAPGLPDAEIQRRTEAVATGEKAGVENIGRGAAFMAGEGAGKVAGEIADVGLNAARLAKTSIIRKGVHAAVSGAGWGAAYEAMRHSIEGDDVKGTLGAAIQGAVGGAVIGGALGGIVGPALGVAGKFAGRLIDDAFYAKTGRRIFRDTPGLTKSVDQQIDEATGGPVPQMNRPLLPGVPEGATRTWPVPTDYLPGINRGLGEIVEPRQPLLPKYEPPPVAAPMLPPYTGQLDLLYKYLPAYSKDQADKLGEQLDLFFGTHDPEVGPVGASLGDAGQAFANAFPEDFQAVVEGRLDPGEAIYKALGPGTIVEDATFEDMKRDLTRYARNNREIPSTEGAEQLPLYAPTHLPELEGYTQQDANVPFLQEGMRPPIEGEFYHGTFVPLRRDEVVPTGAMLKQGYERNVLHAGTQDAAEQRLFALAGGGGMNLPSSLEAAHDLKAQGQEHNLEVKALDKSLTHGTIGKFRAVFNKTLGTPDQPISDAQANILADNPQRRRELIDDGVEAIFYKNETEDPESISIAILHPGRIQPLGLVRKSELLQLRDQLDEAHFSKEKERQLTFDFIKAKEPGKRRIEKIITTAAERNAKASAGSSLVWPGWQQDQLHQSIETYVRYKINGYPMTALDNATESFEDFILRGMRNIITHGSEDQKDALERAINRADSEDLRSNGIAADLYAQAQSQAKGSVKGGASQDVLDNIDYYFKSWTNALTKGNMKEAKALRDTVDPWLTKLYATGTEEQKAAVKARLFKIIHSH